MRGGTEARRAAAIGSWAPPAVLAGAVAFLRVAYAFDVPWNTGDAVRHILYGLAVLEHGPGAADVPLVALSEALAPVPWSGLPFNYPPVALLFDTGAAALSPTLAAWKLALTALEAASALLVWRITRSRWLGLLYWASPISIWWVSHEGQIEPVQNVLALGALLLMSGVGRGGSRRGPEARDGAGGEVPARREAAHAPRESLRSAGAWALLALAVQAKGFALFLLPWFVARAAGSGGDATRRSGGWGWAVAGFGVGTLPTVALAPFWDPANVLRSAALAFNPYFWNPFHAELMGWTPGWATAVDQAVTYGLVAGGLLLAVSLWRRGRAPGRAGGGGMRSGTQGIATRSASGNRARIAAVLGATLFVVALKSVGNAQPWYLLTLPVLWVPVFAGAGRRSSRGRAGPQPDASLEATPSVPRGRRAAVVLFLLLVLADPRVYPPMLTGEPFGFEMGAFYDNVDARTPFRLP